MRWNILSAKRHEFSVNGHTVQGTVTVQWDYETEAPEFDSGIPEYDEMDRKAYESGSIVYIVVSVIVRGEGLEGIDTLGQVGISSAKFETELTDFVKSEGMIDNATDQCTKEILEASVRLQKYTKAA